MHLSMFPRQICSNSIGCMSPGLQGSGIPGIFSQSKLKYLDNYCFVKKLFTHIFLDYTGTVPPVYHRNMDNSRDEVPKPDFIV